MLLQILDDGRLTDGHGRTVDFRNTVIVMTSNLGTGVQERETLGYTKRAEKETDYEAIRERVKKALREHFRPEFLNRLDETIVFEPLTRDELKEIVTILAAEVRERLADRQVDFQLTAAASEALVNEGYDPEYGARPLRRVVERRIENELARRILLSGEVRGGECVTVDYVDDAYSFSAKPSLVVAS